MRRTLITIAVLIVILGIGGFVYWKYFTGGPSLTVAPPASTTLPAAGQAPAGAGQSNVSFTESAAALQVEKVSERLTRIAAGPVVPGEAVVPVYGSSTPAAVATSATTTAKTKKRTPPPALVATDVAVEFIERESGNIFSYLLGAGTLTRTSDKTVPGIMRAAWLPSGERVFATYLASNDLSTVSTYALQADGSGGFFLPQGLSDLAVSSTSVLMLASGATGSVASIAKPDGSNITSAWSSPLSMLRIAFAGKGYLAFTKPSQSIEGDLFSVSSSGRFTKIAGPLPGLVALPSHSGSEILVSSANSGVMQLELVNAATRAVTPLPVATIADKCAWTADDSAIYCGVPVAPSPAYSYPDDWYQGAAHFSDRIWKIDVRGRFAELVLDPSTIRAMGPLDAEALSLDPSAGYLVFVNKNDGSLWSYAL